MVDFFFGRKTQAMLPCAIDNGNTENTDNANKRRNRKETVKRSNDRRILAKLLEKSRNDFMNFKAPMMIYIDVIESIYDSQQLM